MIIQTIRCLGLIACLGSSLVLAERPPSPPQNFYGFQSEQVFAQRRSVFLPVVSATAKGLYVELKRGSKRVSYQATIGLKRKFFVATNFIEITAKSPYFQFQGDGAYELSAASQMQGLDFSYDLQVSELRQTSGSDSMEKIQELERERSDYRDLTSQSFEEGDPRWADLQDTLTLKMELRAEHDVEDAFCILIIPYLTPESHGQSETKRKTALRAQYLGEITGGELRTITLQFELPAGAYDPTNYRLHFYAGDGQPLPTNESKMLKKLTPDEVLDILGP